MRGWGEGGRGGSLIEDLRYVSKGGDWSPDLYNLSYIRASA